MTGGWSSLKSRRLQTRTCRSGSGLLARGGRHRKAGDFEANGYFRNIRVRNEPAILVMVAPLLSFHRSLERLLSILPSTLPLVRVGINQTWKREIKV
jgi:hypothetical protein